MHMMQLKYNIIGQLYT